MRRRAAAAPADELTGLVELARVLGAATPLKTTLARVVEHLEDLVGATSVGVWLRQGVDGELRIAAATGMAWQAQRRARYRAGEGITGRVVQTGKPVVVPRVTREPLFLNRTGIFRKGGAREASFISAPIPVEGRPAGALSVMLPFRTDARLDHQAGLLVLAGSLLGQAVRVEQLLQSERARLQQENSQLRQELKERYDFRNIIGTSRPMQTLYEQMAQVAGTGTTALIRGESGTGKELIAHALHYHSPRSHKPFVKVNCGALPEGLVESELFGHEAGAFTDARAMKKGKFELAHGGTLFLDEVGELSPGTQVKLLRVLQEREIERLGGTHPIKVNVRLIAATNRDLEDAIAARAFREDLYYRLNVFSLYAPPLRDRASDILLLADHFVEKYARSHGKEVRRIATSAIDLLMSYHWPGNVRELENVVERAVLVSAGGVLHAHDLPPSLQTAEVTGTLPVVSLDQAVAALERDLILDALKSARGSVARAARLLDSTERIVAYKVRKLGLDASRFRAAGKPHITVEPA
ncbi:MAG: sigma 54-interacting transcriptional regulator [Vicinamibacterales bacterium]|nr:sigma 54-interacting transcriptional regulator [Vicinamibacterales bacterium]